MTMETINMIMDAMVKGTLTGICISFWMFGLAMVWKWFVGVIKRMIHYLFPNSFKKKTTDNE